MTDVIQEHGLQNLPHGWVKSLGAKLWELRITGEDGIARAIYVTARASSEKCETVFGRRSENKRLEQKRDSKIVHFALEPRTWIGAATG